MTEVKSTDEVPRNQMRSSDNDLWSSFQASTGWLIVMVVIIWAASQGLQPFVDPILVYWTGFVGAFTYNLMHSVATARTRLNSIAMLAIFPVFAVLFGLCVGHATWTLSELRGPCTRLRQELLKHPDSAKSDAYEALHCPSFLF